MIGRSGDSSSGKMDFLSEIYQDAVANIAFLKRQQWQITNYCLLIDAGIVAVSVQLKPLHGAFLSAFLLVLIAIAALGIRYVSRFGNEMNGFRRRVDHIREHHFDDYSANAWNANPPNPDRGDSSYGWEVTQTLCIVIAASTAIALILVATQFDWTQ